MATHATVQNAPLAIDPDSQFPYRETPIWDLAAALQEQWANEQPADWSMVSEVLTRAVDAYNLERVATRQMARKSTRFRTCPDLELFASP